MGARLALWCGFVIWLDDLAEVGSQACLFEWGGTDGRTGNTCRGSSVLDCCVPRAASSRNGGGVSIYGIDPAAKSVAPKPLV